MKAQEHKYANDFCDVELEDTEWLRSPTPPSLSELSCCLFSLCAVSHADVIPRSGKGKVGRSVTPSILGFTDSEFGSIVNIWI